MSRVRTLSEALLAKPKYVALDYDRAETVANLLAGTDLKIPTWDFPQLYPHSDNFEEICLFYLIFNSINYCYFDHDGKRFQDGKLHGSALASVRLVENWKEIQDPTFLTNVDANYLLSGLSH